MNSKEKLALIKETWYDVDLTDEKYIDFDEEQIFSDLEKDLEELEELKKIMGTPIQDIMKRLKILEIIKPYIEITSDGIISCHNLMLSPICDRYKKEYDLLKEYLDGKD